MGLSVKWATCNIGARLPEERGWFFQWAGTTPYNEDRTPVNGGDPIIFDANFDCPYYGGNINKYDSMWSKYTNDNIYSSTGIADNKLILELIDDAAHINIGGGCRMPTKNELQELMGACDIEFVKDYNGKRGALFTLKSNNSLQLFFPEGPYLSGNGSAWSGPTIGIWTSSLARSWGAYFLYLGGSCDFYDNIDSGANRYYGGPIRAVLPN